MPSGRAGAGKGLALRPLHRGATGGTAEAAAALIATMGAEIVECCFIVDLPDVGGRRRLEAKGLKVFALCEFEGE